jgi:hypothetical protein
LPIGAGGAGARVQTLPGCGYVPVRSPAMGRPGMEALQAPAGLSARARRGRRIERAQTLPSGCARRAQHCLAPIAREREVNLEVGGGQGAARVLGPFDEADRASAEVVAEACVEPILFMFESIKIKVIQV